MLEMLYSTGLRGLELCRLSIYDVDLKDGTVIVRKRKRREGSCRAPGQSRSRIRL